MEVMIILFVISICMLTAQFVRKQKREIKVSKDGARIMIIEFVKRLLSTKMYWVKINHKHYNYYFLCFEQIPSFRTEGEKNQIRSAAQTAILDTNFKEPVLRSTAEGREDIDCEDEMDAV